MKGYRSRSRILLDLLRSLARQPGLGVSAMLSAANLSTDRLQGYLDEMQSAGLLRVEEGPRRSYHLTDKGLRLKQELERLERFMADFGMAL